MVQKGDVEIRVCPVYLKTVSFLLEWIYMSNASGGSVEALHLNHEILAKIPGEVVSIDQDDEFLYAAFNDLKVRVISKEDWQIEAVLGDTNSEPLAVNVDDEHLYATCEKRVYVWKKGTWGMIGWFELSYSAITSTLHEDSLFVGAKDGRLVSIKKDTHETSSWQLFKADITQLWADHGIVCLGTAKDEPRVWELRENAAPAELAHFDKKEKGAKLTGDDEFVFVGVNADEIHIYDQVDWTLLRILESTLEEPVSSMWSNGLYLIVTSNASRIAIWDLRKAALVGEIMTDIGRANAIAGDREFLFLATNDGLFILRLKLDEQEMNLSSTKDTKYDSLLRTSPYDVLEGVLVLQKKGDEFMEGSEYHKAVAEYEKALQLLIDNTHALLEVPKERERITNVLNTRLGKSLLRAKIYELQEFSDEVQELSKQIDTLGKAQETETDVEKRWNVISRVIKESRVLAESQAGHILSYQLTSLADELEERLGRTQDKLASYRERVDQTRDFVENLRNEWNFIQRKRTLLEERKAFLERAISDIHGRIEEYDEDNDAEVRGILTTALDEYEKLLKQISHILEAAETISEQIVSTKEEALAAIESLAQVLEKKKKSLQQIADVSEKEAEICRLETAVKQAVEMAESFKLDDEIDDLQSTMNEVLGITDEGKTTKKKKTTSKKRKKKDKTKSE